MKVLDTVVLDKDLLSQDLRRGDVGAVAQVYEPDGLEPQFVTGSGRTRALATPNNCESTIVKVRLLGSSMNACP